MGSSEIYDPATAKWASAGSMAMPRLGHQSTLLDDGAVLISGGGSTTTELYDPAANAWLPGN